MTKEEQEISGDWLKKLHESERILRQSSWQLKELAHALMVVLNNEPMYDQIVNIAERLSMAEKAISDASGEVIGNMTRTSSEASDNMFRAAMAGAVLNKQLNGEEVPEGMIELAEKGLLKKNWEGDSDGV